MKHNGLIYPPGSDRKLESFETDSAGNYKNKKEAEKDLKKGIEQLTELQDKLYAHDHYAVLLIFQAMDAAGKDGTIKHVMSGVNPQGCHVTSFKAPSQEELDHDFLWRCSKALPERGRIGIFNRSYYEEVLVTRVHPEFLRNQRLPGLPDQPENHPGFWKNRFNAINTYEQFLTENGIVILKFFLHVSKEEQKRRFLERINDPSKNWKFNIGDLNERKRWNDYMAAYEEMLKHTSTVTCPWHVIPADKKWYMRAAVNGIITDKLSSLKLKYPTLNKEQKADLIKAKLILENEQD